MLIVWWPKRMCGIIGYVGEKNAMPILLNGLKKLNYRGYDSAGISTMENEVHTYKTSGDIDEFEKTLPVLPGTLGIGHTRWATHGGVSKENAHPHLSTDNRIAVVHNGIIENFSELRQMLEKEGYQFVSETDTEVVAHLIDKYYQGNLEEATRKAVKQLTGSYAIAVMCQDEKQKIVAARNGSPLVLGLGEHENYAASDIPALLDYTNKVVFLDDFELATIDLDHITITDLAGKTVMKQPEIINWSSQDIEKSGYPHFMLKEIHEQPEVIRQATKKRISEIDGWVYFEELEEDEHVLSQINHIDIIACGTSYYAGMTGKYFIEQITQIPVTMHLATEYNPVSMADEKQVTIAISQSGETADTIMAMKKAKQYGAKIIGIYNNPGSTASRIADWTILGKAGPEIGVAATKTFTSQLIILFLLAIHLGRRKKRLGASTAVDYLKQVKSLSQSMQQILSNTHNITDIANQLQQASSAFFIGRKQNYPIALEGALKLKEIAYIHAEGFSAGELKHGPFALLCENTPVIALCPNDDSYEKILSNVVEIKARNAPVFAIADEQDTMIEKYADEIIRIPSSNKMLYPFVTTLICQLLAYHTAKQKGCPIDKPRNLAKSVTVE